jgi:hypothetical protein
MDKLQLVVDLVLVMPMAQLPETGDLAVVVTILVVQGVQAQLAKEMLAEQG